MVRAGTLLKRGLLRLLLYPNRVLAGALRNHASRKAFEDGTTFGALLDRALRLAAHWRRCGLDSGDRVLIDLPNSPAFVEARLAAILGGVVAVPIPPGTETDRLGWIAEFTEARAYLGFRSADLPGLGGVGLDPTAGDREGYELVLARAEPLTTRPRVRGHDLVTINFTSGTTGPPKGVMSTAAGWGWSLYYALGENRVPIGRDEVFLHAIPLATAGSTMILPAVLSGASSLFLAEWDPERAVDFVEKEGVTRIFLTSTMLAEFVDVVRAGSRDVSSLRSVIYGTEGIPTARVRKAVEALGAVLQQGYGMAEALPPVCLLHPDEHARALEEGNEEILSSVGRPTRAVDLRVCGDEGSPLGPREIGSIQLKGKTLSPGYWKRPDLTRATRRNGFYVTGDVGRLDEQRYLHVLGREGRVTSEHARRLVEWAEGSPDLCLAWVEEQAQRLVLTVVPARGRTQDPEALAREAERVAGTEHEVEVRITHEAPKTASYKLSIGTSGVG